MASHMFKVRVIAGFVQLTPSDFTDVTPATFKSSSLYEKLSSVMVGLNALKVKVEGLGLEVQTLRIATNTFTEYMNLDNTDALVEQVKSLDLILSSLDCNFFSIGPCLTSAQTSLYPPLILPLSPRLSLSTLCPPNDLQHALSCADTILELSKLTDDGITNFRYCAQSTTSMPLAPFFPSAYAPSLEDVLFKGSSVGTRVAVGLENGGLAMEGLKTCENLDDVGIKFRDFYKSKVSPLVETISTAVGGMSGWEYVGLDSSLNPSLSPSGSVASAIEQLPWLPNGIAGTGVIGTAAAITAAIKDLGFMRTGYCGIMLPVCEDVRLSKIKDKEGTGKGAPRGYNVTHLMNVSSVCGVGVDTVPLPEDVGREEIAGVVLDVAGLAGKWNKPLSVRMFPVPGLKKGDRTTFDSPYLCNTKVFEL